MRSRVTEMVERVATAIAENLNGASPTCHHGSVPPLDINQPLTIGLPRIINGEQVTFKLGTSGNPAGRPKGSVNRAKAKQLEAQVDNGISPLDFALNMLRDENADYKDRMWACAQALPFVHPKLAATIIQDMTETQTHEQRLAELDAQCDPPKIIDHEPGELSVTGDEEDCGEAA